jgi:predicted phosphodiesterase
MRYGIFADVHSNLEALERVLGVYKNEAIEQYLCLGDVVGYAANPVECIEEIKPLARVTIAGNHDWAAVNLFSIDYFNPRAREAIFWTKRNLDDKSRYFLESLKLTHKNENLTLAHGTLDKPSGFNYMTDGYSAEETFRLLENNICFIGHTHIAGTFIKDRDGHIDYTEDNRIEIKAGNQYIINVGSVGQPRDGNPAAAYCIYDTEKKEVRIKRIDYDIESARKKIIDAGLPAFLGHRLFLGR